MNGAKQLRKITYAHSDKINGFEFKGDNAIMLFIKMTHGSLRVDR